MGFQLLFFFPFDPTKIAAIFFGDSERSKEFHKASCLHLSSTTPICKMGVGKHYLIVVKKGTY